MLEASRFDPLVVYATVDRHRLDDNRPIIYARRSDVAWQKIVKGIPLNTYVHAVREDPKRKGLLYAGTEMGVYVSFNDGDSWLPLQLNLPVVPVHDLVVHDEDLVIATHGRSFWILDDLTPLRQMTPEVAKSSAYFFVPQTAMRVRSDVGHDTPLPAEEPAGPNPPSGAILDYYLAQPAKEVALEILDGSGKVVHKFSSADKPFEADKTVAFTSGWFVAPTKVETTAGEHRFVWDLRYPDPPSLHKNYDISATWGVGVDGLPRGPLVLPGKYEVQITIDGKSYSQPLLVKLDPRLKVSTADLQKQFELEMEISAALRQAYAALQQRGQLPPADSSQTTPPLANTLAATINSLATLLEVVDTADAAPTQQAQEEWRALREKLAEQLH
jgi:hypothetical protein